MKTALVLEGGALRGVYTSGVLDVLMEHHLYLDDVVGISAGSLNGLYYISRQKETSIQLNLNYVNDKRYMGVGNLARDRSFFNFDFVFDEIFSHLLPFDFETFYASKQRFYVGISNCESGKLEFVEKGEYEDFLKVCQASSSMPLLSAPVVIRDQKYLDGGVTCAVPLFDELPFACDQLVLILTRNKGYRKSSVPPILQSIYRNHFKSSPALVDRLITAPLRYNERMDEIDRLEEEGKLFVIRPKEPVSVSRIEKNREKLEQLYEQGRNDAQNAYVRLLRFLGRQEIE